MREYPTTGVKIPAFRDERFFCSNMYACTVVYKTLEYSSSEHAFQAAKCLHPADANLIRLANTPFEAKRLSKTIQMIRPDWDLVQVSVMFEVLRAKFSNPVLAQLLLDTGDEELIEYNLWKDRFWGVWQGKGENYLGRMLMEVRQELREGHLLLRQDA